MRIVLERARLAFTKYLWEPAIDEKSGRKRYNCHLIVKPESKDHKTLKAAIIKCAEEGWPGQGKKKLLALKEQGNICLKNGVIKSDYEGYDGNFFVSVSTKIAPDLRGKNKKKTEEEAGEMYAGCFVYALLEMKPIKYEGDGVKADFISAYVQGMMVVADGDSLEITSKMNDEDLPDIADTGDELGIGDTGNDEDLASIIDG